MEWMGAMKEKKIENPRTYSPLLFGTRPGKMNYLRYRDAFGTQEIPPIPDRLVV